MTCTEKKNHTKHKKHNKSVAQLNKQAERA